MGRTNTGSVILAAYLCHVKGEDRSRQDAEPFPRLARTVLPRSLSAPAKCPFTKATHWVSIGIQFAAAPRAS